MLLHRLLFCCCYIHVHTHTHVSNYLSTTEMWQWKYFLSKKFLKKILFPRINCSDTKYIYNTWDSGHKDGCQAGTMANACIMAAWKTIIKSNQIKSKIGYSFELTWIYWNFMCVFVCVLCFLVGGLDLVVWHDDDLKISITGH